MRDVVDERTFACQPLQIRIGLHSGELIAGVVGEKRFAYDLWGDTVNVASRLESSGLPNEILISEAFRRRVGDAFATSPRGEIELKGKGKTKTFFLGTEARSR